MGKVLTEMTKDGQIETDTLLPQEYIQLRIDVGWGHPEKEHARTALKNSLVVFSKRIDGKAVGTVRVVGDGKLCFYIQDWMVLSTTKRQGIAAELFQSAMNFIKQHAAPNAFIGLMAAAGVDGFYEKYGFIKRPNESVGPGMFLYHERPGELSEI